MLVFVDWSVCLPVSLTACLRPPPPLFLSLCCFAPLLVAWTSQWSRPLSDWSMQPWLLIDAAISVLIGRLVGLIRTRCSFSSCRVYFRSIRWAHEVTLSRRRAGATPVSFLPRCFHFWARLYAGGEFPIPGSYEQPHSAPCEVPSSPRYLNNSESVERS